MTKPLILSATQVKIWESCERQYWYERIAKVPVVRSSAAMQLGLDTETFIEAWLTHGTPPPPDKAGRLASAMAWHLPAPGTPGMEHQLSFDRPVAGLEGVSFTGRLDLRIQTEGLSTIVDFKTTSSIARWALTERTLPENIQAQLYAYNELADSALPSQQMTWLYGQTKGPMETLPVTIAMPRAQAMAGYDRVYKAAVGILALREITDPSKTLFDKSHCNSYGGCPFRAICPATQHQTISQIFQESDMGLLEKLNAAKIATVTATVAPTPIEAAPALMEVLAQPEVVAQPEVTPPDCAPSPDALPEKKTRAKKAKPVEPATTAQMIDAAEVEALQPEPTTQGFTLLVNAVSKDAVSLAPTLAQAAKNAAVKGGVQDYRQVPFGGGAPLLLLAFVELFKPARAFYSIDLRQPESAIVLGYLESKAASVIRGF